MQVVEDAPGQHADDRVPQMVRALSISPQQRSQLSQLRRLFLQKLAKIVNDRKDINTLLLVGGGGVRALLLGAAVGVGRVRAVAERSIGFVWDPALLVRVQHADRAARGLLLGARWPNTYQWPAARSGVDFWGAG